MVIEDAFEIFEDNKIREEFKEAFEKLDEIEVIQLLSDLKYLPLKAFDDGIVQSSELERAIEKFRLDYSSALDRPEASNLDQIKLASEIMDEEEPLPDELTNRELFVLKEITGLDNELVIEQIKENQSTLLSRVLIYRYRVYDLVRTILPNHKLTSSVMDRLQGSAEEMGFTGDWLTFGNLLADQQQLSAFCMDSPLLSNNIFGDCVFIKVKSEAGRDVIHELGGAIKRKRRFRNAIASDAAKTIISHLTSNDAIRREVTQHVDLYMTQTANIFMRRVLQVKLWIIGLYQGRLDHDFGPISIRALSDYLMTIMQNQNEGREELGRILYNLSNDQCIVNIRYLLTRHFIPVEKTDVPVEQSSVAQIFDFVLEDKTAVRSLDANSKKTVKQESQRLKTTLETDLQKESRAIIGEKQPKRRQYRAKKGIMKFFSRLFKFVKNAITKLLKLFERLFRVIKKRIKLIYDEIREAFRNFRYGLEFLFGKRIIDPTPFMTTDYDFDFDGITRIHSKPGAEDIKTHTERIKKYASALYPTLNFVRIVIKWGIKIASGPIGWVKILIGIAKLFREMLRQRETIQLA